MKLPSIDWFCAPGPQAAGTADTLRELGARHGMRVQVMDLLGDASNADGNVSSSEASRRLSGMRAAGFLFECGVNPGTSPWPRTLVAG